MPIDERRMQPREACEGLKTPGQQPLFPDARTALGVHGTFAPNHRESIHRWYPYIEGFSATFAQELLNEFGTPGCRVHDPFAGTGTTVAVACFNGCLPFYSEINPFMRLVIEGKTNCLRLVARRQRPLRAYFDALLAATRARRPTSSEALRELHAAFPKRDFFAGRRLVDIVALKWALENTRAPAKAYHDLARVALGAIAVSCSELVRRADLRYRRSDEKLPSDLSVPDKFEHKAEQICADVQDEHSTLPPGTCLGESALRPFSVGTHVDLVITSPPYLNGTNYFRNTKIELWLTGFLKHEKELGAFRDESMAAGINDISRRGRKPEPISEVERIARVLDGEAYDKRIPELVRRYFSDTRTWLSNCFGLLKPGGTAVVDIGDSRFAGIHVPTDEILAAIAEGVGFACAEVRSVRARRSNDGTPLRQVLVVLHKRVSPRGKHESLDEYHDAAVDFASSLPHTRPPFSSRNWGHGLHSLCSYQGKLKPAIAHFLVAGFSKPGDIVLDPMSGCGTIPLEAFLQGRRALGNDLQELGYILTRAKVERGSAKEVGKVLENLIGYVDGQRDQEDPGAYSDFGFNGRLPEYFNERTYREILAARKYLREHPCESWAQAVVYSALLHVLHGNRPYALSRRSHPVTPFKPTGPSEYRPLASRLKAKVSSALSLPVPARVHRGVATCKPFMDLPHLGEVDLVITSPPFVASTRFYIANWMRLWLAGWEPEDFTRRRAEFLEYQQLQSLDIYRSFFGACARWLRPGGRLIMHVGRTGKCDMARELAGRAKEHFELVYACDENVAGREKFGIRDQGATASHQYLFFRRREP